MNPAHAGPVGLPSLRSALTRSHTGRVTPEPPPSLRDPAPAR